MEELAGESAVGGSGGLVYSGHVLVGESVAGVGLAAGPERSVGEPLGAGVAVARGDCEEVWHPDDGREQCGPGRTRTCNQRSRWN